MGIKNLLKFLNNNYPELIKKINIDNFQGKRIAIDISILLYQVIIAIRNSGADMINKNGDITSHILGLFNKTIILLNADLLTIDAQSALRRCIELFSYNTRFFIIVENKHKLLNPILSRFCEIYVPEHMENGKTINLHQYSIHTQYSLPSTENEQQWITEKMTQIEVDQIELNHRVFTELSTEFYERGLSCLDLIKWVKTTNTISELVKSTCCMCFDKIKSEFRCEKLLLLYIFDFLFLRSNADLKCITTI